MFIGVLYVGQLLSYTTKPKQGEHELNFISEQENVYGDVALFVLLFGLTVVEFAVANAAMVINCSSKRMVSENFDTSFND